MYVDKIILKNNDLAHIFCILAYVFMTPAAGLEYICTPLAGYGCKYSTNQAYLFSKFSNLMTFDI